MRAPFLFFILFVFLFSVVRWTVSVSAQTTKSISTEANFKVAFIGDQGLKDTSRQVLRLIKAEGAQMVLHQGDFDYGGNPTGWDNMITAELG